MGKSLIIKGADFSANAIDLGIRKNYVYEAKGTWDTNVFDAGNNSRLSVSISGQNITKGNSYAGDILTIYTYKTEYDANHATEQTDRKLLYTLYISDVAQDRSISADIKLSIPTGYPWIDISANFGTGTINVNTVLHK